MKRFKPLFLVLLLGLFSGQICATNPPGTIPLSENIYIDSVPVDLGGWYAYTAHLAQTYGIESVEYSSALPHQDIFTSVFGFSFNRADQYFNNCLYDDACLSQPMVGISHQQAQTFCKWRTQRVLDHPETANNIHYQLPDYEQYKTAIEKQKNPETNFHFRMTTNSPEYITDDDQYVVLRNFLGEFDVTPANEQEYIFFRCVAIVAQ